MERLGSTIGKLQSNLDWISSMIKTHANVAGNITFDTGEACTLRSFIETLQKNINELKDIDTELEKIQNYNKEAKDFSEPEDREIKGKTPDSPKKPASNMVDHPLHYQAKDANGNSLECIDVMEAVKGWYHTAIFCELNAFKYNWRLGNKDNVPMELGKTQWYSDKARELWRSNMKWFYPKNQHTYAIIDDVKLKNPNTGEWSDAVLYTDGKGKYVRGVSDFVYKFKKK